MKFQNIVAVCFSALFIFSCSSDDSASPNSDEEENPISNLGMEREQTVATITNNGSGQIWKISQATLNNENGSFDISSNFNVLDDKFIFSSENESSRNLEWRPYVDIAFRGANQEETITDFYLTPINSSFNFSDESSDDLIALNGRFSFSVLDENTIEGNLIFVEDGINTNETMDLVLNRQTLEDIDEASLSLEFSEITTILRDRAFLDNSNIGFVGSSSNNSLYISHRDDCEDFGMQTRTTKIDLNTLGLIEHISDEPDFATRKLEVIDNQLYLVMAQRILTYDLDIEENPLVDFYFDNMNVIQTRYSTCNIENFIYIIGGDDLDSEHRIKRYNVETEDFQIISSISSPKFHAGSEIVNNKIYTFGGRAEFSSSSAETSSFIYDLESGNQSAFDLPISLFNVFAERKGDLIYIVGDTREDTDNDGTSDDINVWTGIYDTITGDISEISNNINDADAFSYIHAMTILNDKMYVIYGDSSLSDPNDQCAQFSYFIMEADLD